MPAEQREQVTHVKMESTGNRRNSLSWRKAGRLPWGGTSRMRREFHVRICEGLGVKFPGPTRRNQKMVVPTVLVNNLRNPLLLGITLPALQLDS